MSYFTKSFFLLFSLWRMKKKVSKQKISACVLSMINGYMITSTSIYSYNFHFHSINFLSRTHTKTMNNISNVDNSGSMKCLILYASNVIDLCMRCRTTTWLNYLIVIGFFFLFPISLFRSQHFHDDDDSSLTFHFLY